MKRRYRYDPATKRLIEVGLPVPRESVAPAVWDDLPAYESPIDGRIVDGRRQRRNDLQRSNSRPYEGREQEMKEAAKVRDAQDRKTDELATRMAHSLWNDAPESARKLFRSK